MIDHNRPAPWFYSSCRNALTMARAYRTQRHMRVLWQERAADYRECIVDKMRQRLGWTLTERTLGKRS